MQLEMRVEKTTRNADDFRVMMVGTMLAIVLMLTMPLVVKAYDTFIATRPFVSATLEIIQPDNGGLPMLLYDADAKQTTDAIWVASIVSADETQIETRRGEWTYAVKEDNPRLWSWRAFFDNDRVGYISPEVPTVDFKICLHYLSSSRRSGILDVTPEFCTQVFHPQVTTQ